MTSIIGYADTLRSKKLDEEEIFKAANYIYTEGKRLEGMSFKLLEMQVTKQQEMELKDVDAQYLGDNVCGALTPLMESTGMELNVDFEPGIIIADTDLIKSVIFNAADNARKANESAGRTKVDILGKLEGDKYIISIIDEGTGIPEEELGKITEAFYMVDKSRARKQGGAGLGLALCKQIMEQLGGTIEFESKVGEGTKIILTLKGKELTEEEEGDEDE